MEPLLRPYYDTLRELQFAMTWSATYMDANLGRRERHEREFREGSAKGIVWVFLEGNETEVSWTMGWDSLGVFDMLCSSTTTLREGLDPLRTFNDRLHELVNKPPTAISESADLNLD